MNFPSPIDLRGAQTGPVTVIKAALRSDGVHLVEAERVVEGLGEGDFADRGTQVRAMSGFCGENAAGSRQVGVAHDRGCGSEVSADSDTWRGY